MVVSLVVYGNFPSLMIKLRIQIMDNIHDVTSACGMDHLWIQEPFLACEQQERALAGHEAATRAPDVAVMVDAVPVGQDVEIILLPHGPQQHDGRVRRLPLQLRDAVLVRERPELFELLVVVQRLSNLVVNVYPLVIEPDSEPVEGSRVGVHQIKLQGLGLAKVAMVV